MQVCAGERTEVSKNKNPSDKSCDTYAAQQQIADKQPPPQRCACCCGRVKRRLFIGVRLQKEVLLLLLCSVLLWQVVAVRPPLCAADACVITIFWLFFLFFVLLQYFHCFIVISICSVLHGRNF